MPAASTGIGERVVIIGAVREREHRAIESLGEDAAVVLRRVGSPSARACCAKITPSNCSRRMRAASTQHSTSESTPRRSGATISSGSPSAPASSAMVSVEIDGDEQAAGALDQNHVGVALDCADRADQAGDGGGGDRGFERGGVWGDGQRGAHEPRCIGRVRSAARARERARVERFSSMPSSIGLRAIGRLPARRSDRASPRLTKVFPALVAVAVMKAPRIIEDLDSF